MKKNWNCHFLPTRGKWLKSYWLMRNFIILFFALNLSAFANGLSQEVSLARYENASLIEVFEDIKVQTGYGILYKIHDINPDIRVNMNVRNSSVQEILDDVLEGTNLDYKVQNEVIVIFRSEKISYPKDTKQEQEKKELKGIVTDSDGNTLPGVSVVVKGTTTGVSTDIDGDYSIQFDNENAVLVFSFVGMLPQEIAYKGQPVINVILIADVARLGEVVATGYYSLPKERSAGASVFVSADEITMKTSESVIERLEGMVPGFVVNSVGEDKFLIRGATSINSSREPLFVVDGMPLSVETLERSVNPNDILSVNVLKDAVSSSIWGARAGNGVVVITTKRGTTDSKVDISYNYSCQFQGKPDFDYLDNMNAKEYVDFYANNVYDPNYNYGNQINNFTNINQVERILYEEQMGNYTSEEAYVLLNRLRGSDNQNQIEDYLYRTKVVNTHNINIKGGNENNQYYYSLSYRNVSPHQVSIDENRIILDMKNDFKLTDWAKFSLNTNLSLTKEKSGYTPNVVGMTPYELLVDEDGNRLSQKHLLYSQETIDWTNNELADRDMQTYDFVMLDEIDKERNVSKRFNSRIQASLKLNLTDKLDFQSNFQWQRGNGKSERLKKSDSYYTLDLIASQTANTGGSVSRIPDGAILDKSWNLSEEWTLRNQLNYDNIFGNKHSINALLGTEIRKNTFENDNRIVYGYKEDTKVFTSLDEKMMISGVSGGSLTNPNANPFFGESFNKFGSGYYKSDNRHFSIYANLAYDYDSRYGVNASVRVDQANLFATEIKYKPIWSVGGFWNIHNEKSFNSNVFNRLTVRLTHGITGNTPNVNVGGPYDIVTSQYPGYNFGWTKPSARISSPKLKNLKWEKTNISNLGIDFSLLSGKLSGSVDMYHKSTTDLIGLSTIDPTSGFSSIQTNIGELRNSGIELALNSSIVRNDNFSWRVEFNCSYNKNKITNIYAESSIQDYVIANSPVFKQGYEAYSLFSYRWAGLSENGEPMVFDEKDNKTTQQISDIKAIVHSGTAQPPISGSISNDFAYKNWRLSILAVFNIGHKIRNDVFSSSERITGDLSAFLAQSSSFGRSLHRELNNAWTNPGDELRTNVPRWVPKGHTRVNPEYYSAADINIIDGSYVSINNITLSYKLPKSVLKKLKGVTISTQVSNPFCFAFNKEGVDPRYVTSMVGYKRSLKYGPEYSLKLNIDF